MIRTITGFTALALFVSLGLITAPGVFAKAHDQGQTDNPGENVGSETAGPAQGLGGVLGDGKGPADTPAGEAPGNSGDAGQPGGNASGDRGK
jgi:hypothetical protein